VDGQAQFASARVAELYGSSFESICHLLGELARELVDEGLAREVVGQPRVIQAAAIELTAGPAVRLPELRRAAHESILHALPQASDPSLPAIGPEERRELLRPIAAAIDAVLSREEATLLELRALGHDVCEIAGQSGLPIEEIERILARGQTHVWVWVAVVVSGRVEDLCDAIGPEGERILRHWVANKHLDGLDATQDQLRRAWHKLSLWVHEQLRREYVALTGSVAAAAQDSP
jgi:DNA-directed RNA polymerase specialized sigma24 family protein